MTIAQTAWKTRPLSECGEWVSGGTPSKSVASYWNGDIPWISSKSLKTFDLSDSEDRISQDAVRNGTKLLPKGAVVFVVRGMSLANEFRVGVTTREVAFNQDLRAIIPRSDMDGRFLARFLRARQRVIMGLTDNASHGTKRLPTELVEAIQVPIPQLPEQHRIAAILDKADAIRRKREEGIRLTEELLRSTFLEMFGDPVTSPSHSLVEIADVVSGVAKGRKLNGRAVNVPYLRVANVQDGYLNLDEIKTIEALPEEVKNLALSQGDIVMTEGGDHDKLGRGAIWNHELTPCIHQNHIFRVRVDQTRLLPEYFAVFLRTRQGKSYFLRCAKKTTNLASINMTQLKGLPVPIPSIQMQRKFQSSVTKIAEISTTRKRSAEESNQLFDSLVQRAFRGEL